MVYGDTAYNTATQAQAWVQTVYSKKIHIKAYQKQRVVRNWTNLNDESQDGKVGTTFTYFLHDNLARTATTTSDSGTALTYVANVETNTTGTAGGIIVPVQIPWVTLQRMILDPRDTLKSSIEYTIAEGVDILGAQKYASIVSNFVGGAGQDITKGLVLAAIGKLSQSAGMYFDPGTTQAWLEYHHSQYSSVMSIPDITAAYARGDKSNPNVAGFIAEALGLNFIQCGTVYRAGGITHNCVHIRESHGIGYNAKTQILAQQIEAAFRLIGLVDVMVMALQEQYAVDVQSQ